MDLMRAYRECNFDEVKHQLSLGADESLLGWTRLFHVVVFGTGEHLVDLVTSPEYSLADLEKKDKCDRDPLLLALLLGDMSKASILTAAGVTTHHLFSTQSEYLVSQDNPEILSFVLDLYDYDNDSIQKQLMASAISTDSYRCVQFFLENGFDFDAKFCDDIQGSADMFVFLYSQGLKVEKFPTWNNARDALIAKLLGYELDPFFGYYGFEDTIRFSAYDYFKDRKPVYGTRNPERANKPFWLSMIKSGKDANTVDSMFELREEVCPWHHGPTWCNRRFGQSFTALPDGRFIEIAGEHEDHYDPNFCIYNDVIVHDGKGQCDIYIYPRDVFPPTDFHTATFVQSCIYIIGSLGYPEDRTTGHTPVYALDIKSKKISKIKTQGEMPGWISQHEAELNHKHQIVITGGNILVDKEKRDLHKNESTYLLCLKSMKWTKQG